MSTRFDPRVDLYVDGAWSDITADVYLRDRISITRGRADEGTRADAGRAALTLNNRSGKYSPRNPLGSLYGKIGRNTPLRARATNAAPTVLLSDTYTRSVADSWGTATSGQTWQQSGGTSAERDVTGTVGTLTIASSYATERHEYVTGDRINTETLVSIKPGQTTQAGAALYAGVITRRIGAAARYACVLQFDSASGLRLLVLNDDGNIVGSLVDPGPGYSPAGNKIWLRVQVVGQQVRGRAWLDGTTEPVAWQIEREVSTVIPRGAVGLMTQISGSPTGTYTISYDDLAVTDPTEHIRFVGEVSSWPPRWDVAGVDVYTPVEASGILRRLGQGASPLRSPTHRWHVGGDAPAGLLAYWSCEDAPGSTSIASALPGGRPARINGLITFGPPDLASYDEHPGSAPLPIMKTQAWFVGDVPAAATTGMLALNCLVAVPKGGDTAGVYLTKMRNTGTAAVWTVAYFGGGGDIIVDAFDSDGAGIFTQTVDANIDGFPAGITLVVTQSGPDIAVDLHVYRVQIDGTVDVEVSSWTLNGRTVGAAYRAELSGPPSTAVGHLAVSNADDFQNLHLPGVIPGSALNGYRGEPAGRRLQRLCAEEAIAFAAIGDVDDTEPVGVQRPATLLDLLDDAAAADGGVLHETRYEVGTTYHTRRDLTNQATTLTLDYAAGQVSPPLEPIEDDSGVRNDITVTREGGSSSRATRDSGVLSVQPPPAGVGRYDEQVTLTLAADSQAADQAGWRLHLGTWDEPRYPTVTVDLARLTDMGAAALVAAVRAVESGARVQITNPPSWLPPGAIDLLTQGYTETFDEHWWTWTVNATPYGPYVVGVVEDAVLGRADTDGSQLVAPATAAATSLLVGRTGDIDEDFEDADLAITVTDGGALPWTRTSAQFQAGAWSLRSGAITHSQTSDAVVKVPAGSTKVRFWYRVSSESGFDFFRFLIDGAQQFQASGTVGWTQSAEYDVTGKSTVTFRYLKDANTSAGEDAAYVDTLTFRGPGAWPLWTTDAAEFPLTALLGGGEEVTVSAISGTTSPQPWTAARAANGISRSWPAGTEVRLAQPAIVVL